MVPRFNDLSDSKTAVLSHHFRGFVTVNEIRQVHINKAKLLSEHTPIISTKLRTLREALSECLTDNLDSIKNVISNLPIRRIFMFELSVFSYQPHHCDIRTDFSSY